jgi:hypothetical protein
VTLVVFLCSLVWCVVFVIAEKTVAREMIQTGKHAMENMPSFLGWHVFLFVSFHGASLRLRQNYAAMK